MNPRYHLVLVVAFATHTVGLGQSVAGDAQLTQAGLALVERYPGVRATVYGAGAAVFYGKPMTSAPTVGEAAQRWLADHGAAFGVDNVDLRPRSDTNGPGERFSVFAYSQFIEGLPVENGMARLVVTNGPPSRVVYAAARLTLPPPGGFGPDAVDAALHINFFSISTRIYVRFLEIGGI